MEALISSNKDFIQIINLPNMTAGRKIMLVVQCRCISSRNGKIWIRSDHNRQDQININGDVDKAITTTFDPCDICGSIYCTQPSYTSIYIISPNGKESEIFRNCDFTTTYNMTIDIDERIFVSG